MQWKSTLQVLNFKNTHVLLQIILDQETVIVVCGGLSWSVTSLSTTRGQILWSVMVYQAGLGIDLTPLNRLPSPPDRSIIGYL